MGVTFRKNQKHVGPIFIGSQVLRSGIRGYTVVAVGGITVSFSSLYHSRFIIFHFLLITSLCILNIVFNEARGKFLKSTRTKVLP